MRPARKFAITASDAYLGIFHAFIAAGWEPVKLFCAPIQSHIFSNKTTVELAAARKIPIQFSPMTEADLASLAAHGCELLVVASYQWRIGDWARHLPRAVNFHPSPLPMYRGPYPLVQALLDRQERWGVTCHRVSEQMDAGDILDAEYFPIASNEWHESLALKTQMALSTVAQRVAQGLDGLWDHARPQGEGHYVGYWNDATRTLDFGQTCADIDTRLRAFGDFECLARANDLLLHVRRAVCWQSAHHHAPGAVVSYNGSQFVLACRDGYVGIIEWSLVPPGMYLGPARR